MNQQPEQKLANPSTDPLALTPFLGSRDFKKKGMLFTPDREQAFQRAAKEFPEEALLFLNEQHLRTRAKLLKEKFIPPEEGGRVAYAVKANSHQKILKILTEAGITSFDCASTNEMSRVQELQPNAEIFYNHPIKKHRDIREAVDLKIRHFTVQTKREIEKILRNAHQVPREELEIAVRLDTPNPEAGINLSEKFGATPSMVSAMIADIKKSGAKPGISIHIGSQNTDPHLFAAGIRKMLKIAMRNGGVRSINVGGGLPVNIFENDDFDLEAYLEIITSTIRSNSKDVFSGEPKMIIEPGRAMVAESIDLLIPILSVEERKGEKVMYMDDGVFTSFSDAVIHSWQYPFRPWRKTEVPFSSKKIPIRVFGRTCDSGDSVGLVQLPEDIQEGDYLHVPTAGAYTDSQASHFNGFEPPRYVSYNIS